MNQDIQIVDQNGIRLLKMNIIEIYRENISTVWHDGKTFLLVFDDNNKEIADYDFSTGLKLLQDGNIVIVFIDDKDLVPGNWKFFGTKIIQKENRIIEEKIEVYGKKEGKSKKRNYLEKDPWNKNRVVGEYVSSKEREKRIEICRSCPLFSHLDGTCLVNGNIVIELTKEKYSYCPEEKWGDKEKAIEFISSYPEGDIIMPEGTFIDQEDQENFEKELDEYLKGL